MLTPKDPSAAFFLPFTRFWELLAGAWLALRSPVGTAAAPPRRHALAEMAAVVGLALVLVACFILDDQAAFPGWRALLPVIGCLLMMTATPATRWMHWLLSRPALVWIGLVSYPLYLWHWPLLSFARIHA